MTSQTSKTPATHRREAALHRAIAMVSLLLLGFATFTLTAAPDPALDMELGWQRNWKNYARRCVKIRDTYYLCAAYENQYPSSRGTTTVAFRQKTTKEVTARTGANLKVKRNLIKPNEEIDAGVRTLPEIAVGHYGSIHSAQIVEIIGPDEMIVAAVWLIDPQQVRDDRDKEEERLNRSGADRGDVATMLDVAFEIREGLVKKQADRSFRSPIKLRGFSTAGLAKGERWTGGKEGSPQIAIVAAEVGEQKSKYRKPVSTLVAIPAESFMKPITDEKEFLALLASRGFTKEMFVALVLEEKKVNASDDRLADALIFAKLEAKPEEKAPEEKTTAKPKRSGT